MKVESNRYNTPFTALYMPAEKQTAKTIGKFFAQQAEIARRDLKELAVDMDIYVEPFKYGNGKSGFSIYFARLGSDQLGPMNLRWRTDVGKLYKKDFKNKNADIPTILINKVKALKESRGDVFIKESPQA